MTLVFPRESLNAFPKHLTPGYRSTVKRSPSKPLILVPQTLSELTGPVYGHDAVQEGDNDLTKQHKGEPLGERIIVHGYVVDEDKRGVPDTLVEIWQANAWRPNHIHFSVFGHSFLSRFVTQMYFPGDPLFPFDPIFNSVTDDKARMRMVSSFDLDNTIPDWALCFRFDIVLRGREATPQDTDKH